MSEVMSKEEIIDSIKPIINARKTHKDDNLYSLQLNAYQLDTIQGLLDLYQKEKEKNKKLEKENNEIRDWKYTIDTVEDLDLLTRLDNIKIKGKEYISKDIYLELEKDKKALVKNYDKVLSQFISKDKIREKIEQLEYKVHIVIPNEYNKIEIINEFKNEGAISALQELLERKNEM